MFLKHVVVPFSLSPSLCSQDSEFFSRMWYWPLQSSCSGQWQTHFHFFPGMMTLKSLWMRPQITLKRPPLCEPSAEQLREWTGWVGKRRAPALAWLPICGRNRKTQSSVPRVPKPIPPHREESGREADRWPDISNTNRCTNQPPERWVNR